MAYSLFYIFSFITVASAALVVVSRNAVNAAMSLMLSLIGLAGLFVVLNAALLAFMFILVYAGAVVALFLFIIMLIDTKTLPKPFSKTTFTALVIGGFLLALGVYSLIKNVAGTTTVPTAMAMPPLKNYAEQLFTTYLLPVQIVGFLLLTAMLGVIVLSKKFAPVKKTA